MARLNWDRAPHSYDLGVDRGVLYLDEGAVAWNGLVSVNEDENGQVDTNFYYDGFRVHIAESSEVFSGDISAFTYPPAFEEYNGYSETERYKRFGLSYRTQHGPDDYKIHLVYQALLLPDSPSRKTITNKADPTLFNWNVVTNDIDILGGTPTAHVVLDSRELSWVTRVVEDMLYGTETTDPRLPSPEELIELYESATILRITYNYDGTYTARGEPEVLQVGNDGTFRINAPTVIEKIDGLFSARSYAR